MNAWQILILAVAGMFAWLAAGVAVGVAFSRMADYRDRQVPREDEEPSNVRDH